MEPFTLKVPSSFGMDWNGFSSLTYQFRLSTLQATFFPYSHTVKYFTFYTFTPIANLESPFNLTCKYLDCGRKLWYLVVPHAGTGPRDHKKKGLSCCEVTGLSIAVEVLTEVQIDDLPQEVGARHFQYSLTKCIGMPGLIIYGRPLIARLVSMTYVHDCKMM